MANTIGTVQGQADYLNDGLPETTISKSITTTINIPVITASAPIFDQAIYYINETGTVTYSLTNTSLVPIANITAQFLLNANLLFTNGSILIDNASSPTSTVSNILIPLMAPNQVIELRAGFTAEDVVII